jgi:hypothetical protein
LSPLFKRKNPADAAVERWQAELERAKKRAESLDDHGLVGMVRESGAKPLHRLEAGSRLGARGRLDLVGQLLVSGDAASGLGGIDGACLAACNGGGGAIELLSALPGHPDPEVRLRAAKSLAMVADGTPSDLGSSTREIRQAARTLLEQLAGDSDYRARDAAQEGLTASEGVEDVRRGPDQLTYLGRRVTEELLTALDQLPKQA